MKETDGIIKEIPLRQIQKKNFIQKEIKKSINLKMEKETMNILNIESTQKKMITMKKEKTIMKILLIKRIIRKKEKIIMKSLKDLQKILKKYQMKLIIKLYKMKE